MSDPAPSTVEGFDALCRLARLDVPGGRRERLRGEFATILGYVETLRGVPTEGVEPTTQVQAADAPSGAPRGDDPAPCLPREEVLRAAPKQDGIFFDVPKMREDA